MEQEIAADRGHRPLYRTANEVTVSFTRGAPVTLERRDGQWFVDNQPVGRKLDTAIAAVKDNRDVEAGFLLRVDAVLKLGQTPLAPRGSRCARRRSRALWRQPCGTGTLRTRLRRRQYRSATRERASNEMSQHRSGRLRHQRSGNVGIVADNAVDSPAEAVAILYHEVLGHVGMAADVRCRSRRTIMDMYNNSPALRDMVDQWKVAVGAEAMEFYGRAPMWVQVEEAIATRSESGPIRPRTCSA
jgi:hypothetical protein